jgi:hypothetical protein
MAPLTDYRTIIDIIDRTFTRHEHRLAEIREETIAYMRAELQQAFPTTHVTMLLPKPEESRDPVSSD